MEAQQAFKLIQRCGPEILLQVMKVAINMPSTQGYASVIGMLKRIKETVL
jgi:hypothetical protein